VKDVYAHVYGSYKWFDLLSRLVLNYNARKHRTIGMRPVDVTPAVTERFLATMYNHVKIAGPAKIKVGDSVRVSKYKTIFEKDYTPNWTTEMFKIVKVQHTNPVTYLLEDYRGKSVAGAFYEYELHRATYPDIFLVEKVLRTRFTESGWDSMDRTIHGYTRTMQFDLYKIFNVKRIKKIHIYNVYNV